MQRFYFPDLEEETDNVTINNKDFINQLLKVLRVKPGFELIFFNGKNNIDQIYHIISIDKREIYLEKIGFIEKNSEINFDLNIFQSLPNKSEKIEYILQKGVEVGVTGFYFYKSEKSQKLNLSENKIIRLNKIITEAVEQSGRSKIPELIIEDNISLEYFKKNENIFFHTEDNNSTFLKDLKLNYSKGINIFIGPEGGFTDREIKIFEENKFKKVFMGDRILRTETVGAVVGFFITQNKD